MSMNEYALKWNKEIIEEILINFQKGIKKQAIIQATGTGKSYIIYKIIEKLKENSNFNVLYLSPSLNINDQFEDRIPNEWNVKVITYQSLNSLYKNGLLDNEEFKNLDLIVVDELHRIMATNWRQAFKKLESYNKEAFYLGATATPKRMDQLRENKDTVDKLFNGVSVSNLTLAKAIKYHILMPPEYYVGVFKIKEQIKDLENKYKNNEDEFIDNEPLRDKLREMKTEWEKTTGEKEVFDQVFDGRKENDYKFIVFCPNKQFVRKNRFQITDNLAQSLGRRVNSYEYYSGTGEEDWENFKNAKSGVRLLFVIEMLNEGYHLEGLDGAIMYRGTDSHIVYYQQLGRVLSVSNAKSPIVIDMVNNQSQFSRIKELKEEVEQQEQERGWNWEKIDKTAAEIQFSIIKPDISILVEELEESMNLILYSDETLNGDLIVFDEMLSKYPKVSLKDLKMWIKSSTSKEVIENSCNAYYELMGY